MNDNNQAVTYAANTVPLIESLISNAGYNNYFIPLVEKKIKTLEMEILEKNLTYEEILNRKSERKALIEIIAQVAKDLKNNKDLILS